MRALSYYTGVDTSAGICLAPPGAARPGAAVRVLAAWLVIACAVTPGVLAQGAPSPPSDTRQEAPAPVAFPGGVVWEIALAAQPAFRPVFDDRRMFAALKDNTLVAVTLDTGAAAWSVSQASTVPLAVAGGLLIGADGADLWARDAATGAPRWQHRVDAGTVAAMAASPDTACLATSSGTLLCVHASDGTPRWQQAASLPASAGPAMANGRVFVGRGDGSVQAYGLDTGRALWTRVTKGTVVTLSVTDTRVVVGTDSNTVYTLDAAKGKQKWKWRTGGDPVGSAIVVGKRLYYVAYDNTLRAHNLRNGHLAWARPLVSRPVGGPVSIGDRVLVASVAPHLRAFKVTDGTPDGVVALPGKAVDQPHLVAALGDLPPMVVVVTGGGQIQAIGQTIEPAVVPLEALPGARLIPETLRR